MQNTAVTFRATIGAVEEETIWDKIELPVPGIRLELESTRTRVLSMIGGAVIGVLAACVWLAAFDVPPPQPQTIVIHATLVSN